MKSPISRCSPGSTAFSAPAAWRPSPGSRKRSRHLAARSREGLELSVFDGHLADAVRGIYEQQVLDASTWPFNPAIVGRVLASAVAPLSLYVLKIDQRSGRVR